MRPAIGLAVASLIIIASSGCGIIRGIEQWKCDNLGMCHFGIQPSNPSGGCCGSNPAAYPPPVLLPPPASQQPIPDPYQGF